MVGAPRGEPCEPRLVDALSDFSSNSFPKLRHGRRLRVPRSAQMHSPGCSIEECCSITVERGFWTSKAIPWGWSRCYRSAKESTRASDDSSSRSLRSQPGFQERVYQLDINRWPRLPRDQHQHPHERFGQLRGDPQPDWALWNYDDALRHFVQTTSIRFDPAPGDPFGDRLL